MKAQIALHQPVAQPPPAGPDAVPLAHQRLLVEEVDGQLQENGAGHAALCLIKRFDQRRHNLPYLAHAARPLGCGPEQTELVDVLQGAAPLQHRGRGPAQQHQRCLGHLGALDGGECVGDAWPGGDDGHAGYAAEPGHGFGGKDGVGLVARIDHADAALLAGHQDGGDVPTGQGEDKAHAMRLQNFGNPITTMHAACSSFPFLPVVWRVLRRYG